MLPAFRPPVLSLSTMACKSASCQGIFGPPIKTLSTPSCLICRIDSTVMSRPSTGAQILGVLGPSCGIPGPCGPLYSGALSAAADGSTAAADKAAVEQMSFMRLLREKLNLMRISPNNKKHYTSSPLCHAGLCLNIL